MASASASSSSLGDQPPLPGVLHLERFLDTVLKDSLQRVLAQRDTTRTAASQCTQLIALFDDMRAMSRRHSFIATSSSNERVYQQQQQQQQMTNDASGEKPSTAPSSSTTSSATHRRGGAASPAQTNKILVDLGHHFYTQGFITNAERVHVNLGCGVVLPMSTEEARLFLVKKERVLRERASFYTREVLRIKYRIRLVTEAIARLHERQVGSSR